MKKFLFIFSILVLILALSSCMLVRGSSKPMIVGFTKSATLLSGKNIQFFAQVLSSNGGLSNVVFDLDGAPLPTTLSGTSFYTANWIGVYGYNKVTLYAIGTGGNVATKTDTFFVKDSTPPIVKVLYPVSIAQNVNFPVNIDVYDPESGIQSVSVSVNGKNIPFVSNTLNLSFQNLGIHDLTVTAINGQGLISTPTFYINVVKPIEAKPYIQFTEVPNMMHANRSSTITVYAYSPNGIKSVDLQFLGVTEKFSSPNASNTYTFNLKLPAVKTDLYVATCTAIDEDGNTHSITNKFFVISNDATNTVYIPTISASSTGDIKIPFFAASDSGPFTVSAYIDDIPVQIYGDMPNFYVLWPSSEGNHTLSVLINGTKLLQKMNFDVR